MRIIEKGKIRLADVSPGEVFSYQGITYMCIVNSTGRTISDVQPGNSELAVDLSTGELEVMSPDNMVSPLVNSQVVID